MKLRRLARRRARRLALIAVGMTIVAPAGALARDGDDWDDDRAADLTISFDAAPALVQAGASVTFTARITNLGPRKARVVRAAIALTGQVPIRDLVAPAWSCDVSGSLVNCVRRRVRRGTTSTITVSTVAPPGFVHVAAGAVVASSRTPDIDPTSNTATQDIAINNPPVVVDDSGQAEFEKPVEIPVLKNDFDPDGDPIDYAGIAQPAHGAVDCDVFRCRYTPAAGYSGPDSFGYTLADDRGGSASGQVTVTVAPPLPPSKPPSSEQPPPLNSSPGATVSGPIVVTSGQTGSYTTIVSNGCKVVAENVVVRITLPAGTTVMSAPSRSVRRGRILTIPIGTIRAGTPRGVGVRLRFGKNGGSLRTLVAAVRSSNGRLTGDGLVINVR